VQIIICICRGECWGNGNLPGFSVKISTKYFPTSITLLIFVTCEIFYDSAQIFVERLQESLRLFLTYCSHALALNKQLIGLDQISFHTSLEQGFADLKSKMEKYRNCEGYVRLLFDDSRYLDSQGPEEEEPEQVPPVSTMSSPPTHSGDSSINDEAIGENISGTSSVLSTSLPSINVTQMDDN
jgi:Dock homology region 2